MIEGWLRRTLPCCRSPAHSRACCREDGRGTRKAWASKSVSESKESALRLRRRADSLLSDTLLLAHALRVPRPSSRQQARECAGDRQHGRVLRSQPSIIVTKRPYDDLSDASHNAIVDAALAQRY